MNNNKSYQFSLQSLSLNQIYYIGTIASFMPTLYMFSVGNCLSLKYKKNFNLCYRYINLNIITNTKYKLKNI